MDVVPFALEAIEALGLVRREALEWLATNIVEHVDRGQARSIRASGHRLTSAQRIDRGLPARGEPLSEEVWTALTLEGRSDPIASFDDTVARVVKRARNAARIIDAARHLRSGMFAGVVMALPPGIGLCEAGLKQSGKFIPFPPELPLPGCDRRFCSCSWRIVTHREADRSRSK